jgi:hypothetical protein
LAVESVYSFMILLADFLLLKQYITLGT